MAATNASSLVEPFGHTADGRAAFLYTLQNEFIRVRMTDFGGRVVSVETPDRNGRRNHILLGFDSVSC
jgi:aldose 1-epimerase